MTERSPTTPTGKRLLAEWPNTPFGFSDAEPPTHPREAILAIEAEAAAAERERLTGQLRATNRMLDAIRDAIYVGGSCVICGVHRSMLHADDCPIATAVRTYIAAYRDPGGTTPEGKALAALVEAAQRYRDIKDGDPMDDIYDLCAAIDAFREALKEQEK